MRIELTAGGTLPGEAVEGRLTGKVKRKPRSILVEIVTVESAKDNTSTTVRSSQRFRDLSEGDINQAFSLKLPAVATQAGSCIDGKVAWIIRARADLAGLDQKTERPIPVKRPPHRVSAQDHPSAKVIKGAIQAQRSNLPQYKPHGRRQQEFLMFLPVVALAIAIVTRSFGPIAITVLVLSLIPAAVVIFLEYLLHRSSPKGVEIRLESPLVRQGTRLKANIMVEGVEPMVALFSCQAMVEESSYSHSENDRHRRRYYKLLKVIAESEVALVQGNNEVSFDVTNNLPTTYSGEVVGFTHQLAVRRAKRRFLPLSWEPKAFEMIGVLG